ncbi:hypothetical protein [Oryzomonas japonica]|nr:hypothetical protein [Oryzomonas japonica]
MNENILDRPATMIPLARLMTMAATVLSLSCSPALAGPTAQINIPSTDAKALKEVAVNISNYARLSDAPDAGGSLYNVGVVTGLLPWERLKLEAGVDYTTTGTGSKADTHPFSFNVKLATVENAVANGSPAFAVGMYNLGTYDKPEIKDGISTRQNIAYLLAAKTLPLVGRLTCGGYYGSERALATPANTKRNNSGILVSWDRTITELSDKLWLGVEYMGGNNPNGEMSFAGSWAFSKQVALLVGMVIFNPFYRLSPADNGAIPGGKPAITTQLTINLP